MSFLLRCALLAALYYGLHKLGIGGENLPLLFGAGLIAGILWIAADKDD